jgi:hypothetical protein
MKKFFTMTVLAGLLVFTTATCAFAESYGSFHLGYADNDMGTGSHEMIGIEVNSSDSLLQRVGVDIFNSTAKANDGADAKLEGHKIKVGFGVIKSDNFELYGMLSSLSLCGDSKTSDVDYHPILAGIEGKIRFNERLYIDGAIDYAVAYKEYERNGAADVDADYMAAKASFNYLVTEKLGVAVGYTWDELKVSGNKTNTDGLTAAIVFWF